MHEILRIYLIYNDECDITMENRWIHSITFINNLMGSKIIFWINYFEVNSYSKMIRINTLKLLAL